MKFPDIASVESHLNSLINYEHVFPLGGARDRPKLEPTYQAVERLGLSLRLPKCIHIAGTKGKGSVVSFLEAIFIPEYSVLSFTSPHLISFTERVRWNGKPLPNELWQEAFENIVPVLRAEPEIDLTYFELTWITFLWAARQLITSVNIVEAGLGGKWDATNVLENTVAVLTSVDYDHTDVLGNSLSEIAADKGGIIKPSANVVIGRQPEEALREFRSAAVSSSAHAFVFGEQYSWLSEANDFFCYEDADMQVPSLSLSSPGLHQRDNAAVAIRAARILQRNLSIDSLRSRLVNCIVPGRQQLLKGKPEILIDVAHNPVSFRALAETIRLRYSDRRILAAIGMMKNKDARASLSALKGLVNEILVVELNSPRSANPFGLQEVAATLGITASCPPSRKEAFTELHKSSHHDLGLVAGSFYLVGDYLIWRKRAGIA